MPQAQEAQQIRGNYVLKVISGGAKGSEFQLDRSIFTIGRSAEGQGDNHIVIPDNLVSRSHCRLSFDGVRWNIEDLDSTNGTWLVGQKVSRLVAMPEKTPVRVGNTLFEVYNKRSADETVSLAMPMITVRMQPETFAPSASVQKSPDQTRTAAEQSRQLSSIYKFQNAIASTSNLDKLYSRIVSAVIELMPVNKVFLIIYWLDSGKFEPVAGMDRKGAIEEIGEGEISSNIVDFVKENRESVLSVGQAKENNSQPPQGQGKVPLRKSTMCVPMLVNQQLTGMIYFEMEGSAVYEEDDLSLATVIAHSAALAIENIRLLEFNLKNERLVATGTTAAGLSHYIKNILAGLDGSLNLLHMAIEEKDLGMAGESLSILSKNHRRLVNLVLDLLNLTSEQKLNLKINDLNAVIDDAIELMAPQLKQQGIELTKNPAISSLPLYAEFDATGIHRVLLNLILNSEHAIQSKFETIDAKEGGMILINARFSDTKDYIIVSVSDNGTGISGEDAEKIFEIFFTSKGSAGTGLGLAVTKRIIEAHAGTVSASGKKGESCTIAFTLPISHNESNTITHAIKRLQ